jgi:type IV pilus assembly protein PilB
MVRAEQVELLDAINHHYGQTETESVDSIFYEFPETTLVDHVGREEALSASRDPVVIRLVSLVITEAIRAGANGIRFIPTGEGVTVRYRVNGEWEYQSAYPARLWPGIAARVAVMAWIPVDAVLGQRPPVAGAIPLRLGNNNYELRGRVEISASGLHIEFDVPPDTSLN